MVRGEKLRQIERNTYKKTYINRYKQREEDGDEIQKEIEGR